MIQGDYFNFDLQFKKRYLGLVFCMGLYKVFLLSEECLVFLFCTLKQSTEIEKVTNYITKHQFLDNFLAICRNDTKF